MEVVQDFFHPPVLQHTCSTCHSFCIDSCGGCDALGSQRRGSVDGVNRHWHRRCQQWRRFGRDVLKPPRLKAVRIQTRGHFESYSMGLAEFPWIYWFDTCGPSIWNGGDGDVTRVLLLWPHRPGLRSGCSYKHPAQSAQLRKAHSCESFSKDSREIHFASGVVARPNWE